MKLIAALITAVALSFPLSVTQGTNSTPILPGTAKGEEGADQWYCRLPIPFVKCPTESTTMERHSQNSNHPDGERAEEQTSRYSQAR